MRREPRFNLRRLLGGTRGLGLGLLLAALLALARNDSGRTSGHGVRTESRPKCSRLRTDSESNQSNPTNGMDGYI